MNSWQRLTLVGIGMGVLLAIAWPKPQNGVGGGSEKHVASEVAPSEDIVAGENSARTSRGNEQQGPRAASPGARLVTKAVKTSVDATGSPNYDPLVYLQRDSMVPRDVFELEEKSAVFADRREHFLQEKTLEMLAENYPDAEVRSVECRTSSCRLVVFDPSNDLNGLLSHMQSMHWGDAVQPSTLAFEGGIGIQLDVLYTPATRNHEEFEETFFGVR